MEIKILQQAQQRLMRLKKKLSGNQIRKGNQAREKVIAKISRIDQFFAKTSATSDSHKKYQQDIEPESNAL